MRIKKLHSHISFLLKGLEFNYPIYSSHYFAHLVGGSTYPAIIGNLIGAIYKPNNVTEEGYLFTALLEKEILKSFANLFDLKNSNPYPFGFMTSGGTISNYESLLMFKRLRALPFLLRDWLLSLASSSENKIRIKYEASDWELMNTKISDSVNDFLEVFNNISSENEKNRFLHFFKEEQLLTRFNQLNKNYPFQILYSHGSHYSIKKGINAIGFNIQNRCPIPLDENHRLDKKMVEAILEKSLKNKIPIFSLILTLGSTEFGSVDAIHEFISLRNEYEKMGLTIPIHVDGAYGAYFKCLMKNEKNKTGSTSFLNKNMNDALKALPQVDSLTLDPHKLGHIPYPCSFILFQERKILQFMSIIKENLGNYLFYKNEQKGPRRLQKYNDGVSLGKFTLEGSRCGGSILSLWLSNKIYPLHQNGIGKLLKIHLRNASQFQKIVKKVTFKNFKIELVSLGETDIHCFFIKPNHLETLNEINLYNQELFHEFLTSPKEKIYFGKTLFRWDQDAGILRILRKNKIECNDKFIFLFRMVFNNKNNITSVLKEMMKKLEMYHQKITSHHPQKLKISA